MKLESYFTTLGSLEEQKRLDIISNNIANANSPGFKKDSVHFSDVLGEVSYTSMSQGPIHQTGNDLDIALSGDGFLSVQTDQGILYTRAGNLTLNNAKQLVTQDGWPVLGKDAPISIQGKAKLRITEDGQIFDGDNAIGSIDIVQFPPDVSLKKAQNGYFEPQAAGTQPEKATNCFVHQGALEGANFNLVEEMARMVQTTRNYESYQKTIQNSANLDSQVISKMSG
ncbi:MAG: flagellar hook basal-body protein [Syntrophobacteraceae bacterium]|jgi:flagellar basal-body rod protein FlgG